MSLLTPLIKQQTSVPAPDYELVTNGGITQAVAVPSSSRTVSVTVCSEFMVFSTPLNVISSNSNINLVQDGNGQPIIFALSGAQQRLLCLIHVNGGPTAFQSFDISPEDGSSHINAFDIYQAADNVLYLAASVLQSDSTCDVYYSAISVPNIMWDSAAHKLVGFSTSQISWTLATNNLGRKNITVLSVSPSSSENFHLVAGSQATQTKVATQYSIATDGSSAPWSIIPLPQTAASALQVYAGNLSDGPGVFTLFSRPQPSLDVGCVFDTLSGGISYEINLHPLGTAQGIYPNANPWGQTDLFVASSNGLGFYDFQSIDEAPRVILPGINFKQVVSAEATGTLNADTQSYLTVFAVSEHDELYYIQGIRTFETGVVHFQASGVPIRTNVDRISAQYNSKNNASEIIYVGNGQDEIRHLLKDPVTSLWQENSIAVQSTGAVVSYPAYITTVTFADDLGNTLGSYPFSITSTLANVLINERTHLLDTSPTALTTDQNGVCSIVVRADNSLAAAQYQLQLTQFAPSGIPVSITLEPTQRVLRVLAGVKSAQDIQNAKSTTNVPVFKNGTGDFDMAASVTSNLPMMLHTVDPSVATSVIGAPNLLASGDTTVSWQRDSSGKVTKNDGSWIDQAIDGVEHFLGDLLEAWKELVELELKVALKVLGPVILFYIEIEGKILKFVLSHIGPLLRGFAELLKDTLGIDVTGFLNWLGFLFDLDNIKATQKVMEDVFTQNFKTCQQFLKVNEPVVKGFIDLIRLRASAVVKDKRPPIDDAMNTVGDKVVSDALDFLFNNPVMKVFARYNPLSIITSAIGQEFGDQIQLPDAGAMSDIMSRIIPKLLELEADNLIRWLDDLGQKISGVVNGSLDPLSAIQDILGDTFWTMFDAFADLILALIEIITDVFSAGLGLLTGKWKIPLISDLWEDLTDEDLTLLNLISFPLATGLNIYYQINHQSLPFDPNENYGALMSFTDDQLSLDWALKALQSPSTDGKVVKSVKQLAKPAKISSARLVTHPAEKSLAAHPLVRLQSGSSDPVKTWKHIDTSLTLSSRILNSFKVVWECMTHLSSAANKNPTLDPNNKLYNKNIQFYQGNLKGLQVHLGDLDFGVLCGVDTIQLLIRLAQIIILAIFAKANTDSAMSSAGYTCDSNNFGGYVFFKAASLLVTLVAFITQCTAKGNEEREDTANKMISVAGILDSLVAEAIFDFGGIQTSHDTADKELFSANMSEVVGNIFAIIAVFTHQSVRDDPEMFIPMLVCLGVDGVTNVTSVGLTASAVKLL